MVLEIDLWAYLVLFWLLGAQMAVLLWAGGAVVGLTVAPRRVVLGALAGAAYAVAVDLARFGAFDAGLLASAPVVLLVSLLSFLLAYWPLPAGRLLRALGAYYFLAVVGAGVAYAVYNLGGRGWVPPLTATVFILATAELGWGVVQRWVWDRVLYVPVDLELLGRKVRVTALLDTGNRLSDPLTGQPVLVLGSDLAEELLPAEAVAAVRKAAENPVAGVELLAETPLASRLRLIPYSTLGRDEGLLVSFRADAVRVAGGENAGPALVAFYRQPLDPGGSYRALIHPSLFQSALAEASRRRGRLALGHHLGVPGPVSRSGG